MISLTKEKEKQLLIALSQVILSPSIVTGCALFMQNPNYSGSVFQVLRQIKLWTNALDDDSDNVRFSLPRYALFSDFGFACD